MKCPTACVVECAKGQTPACVECAKRQACSVAREVFQTNSYASQVSLSVLKNVIRGMSAKPGRRLVLLLSPGFIAPQMEYAFDELVEQALRAQVIVSSLNGRGLYTISPNEDIASSGMPFPEKMRMVQEAALADEGILGTLACGTGGEYFHNNNDFDQGFREIAAPPEYTYVLGFAPQALKPDGKFHQLKVTVKGRPKLTLQARKGYFAPQPSADPATEAHAEIEDALFSQDEVRDFPIELGTQFFSTGGTQARLTVSARIDVKRLHFRRTGERNTDSLTIVSGLFDRDGQFVSGVQKVVDMGLKDDTLANRLDSGIVVKSSFDVKPGTYFVRLVVRDSEGQLSAASGSVEIP
jgi:hypothetical protein